MYTELTGMLSGAAPARAVTLLHAAGLLPVVFASPPGLPHPTGWDDRAMALVRRMTALDPATAATLVGAGAGAGAAAGAGGAALGGTREGPALAALSPEQRRLALLAGVLAPLAGLQFQQGKKQVTSSTPPPPCRARGAGRARGRGASPRAGIYITTRAVTSSRLALLATPPPPLSY